ncbi:MAG: caspase family protein [Chitinophagaceae bacterium]|nr:caspase family protein [Chitinophagaceae bacterium]
MSPDGSKVYSYSWRDSTGFIWDIKNRKEISRLKVETSLFSAFAGVLSNNNLYLITQNKIMPEEIAVWEVSTGKKLYELGKGDDYDRKQYPAMAVFNNAGNSILCNDKGWVTHLMNLKTGRIQLTISDSSKIAFRDSAQTIPSAATEFSFSPNGEYIITRNIHEVLKVWNVKTGKMLYSFGIGDAVIAFQFSIDGEYLLVRSKMKINVLDLATGKLIQTFSVKGHTTEITASCISNDHSLLATAGKDYHIRLWNLQTAQMMKVMSGHSTLIRAMNFNPAKTMLATGVEGKAACTWDIEKGWVDKKFEHGHQVTDVSFSADGKTLLTASADSFVRTWNAETGKLMNKMRHNGSVFSAKFSPDGKHIISGSYDKTAKGWDAVSGQILFTLNHTGWVDAAAYYPDGESILTHDITGKYFVWNSDFRKDKMELIEEHGGTGLSFTWQLTPDGKYDVAWFRDTLWKWNRNTGKLQKNYFPDGKYKMNFSNDGKWLYTNAGSELKFYSANDFTFRYRIVAIDSADYFTQLPSGYYQCTPAAAKQLHYVTKDQKIITFDQLDVKYNRPDKVLEAIGNTDTAFINSFKRAYIKRIKKLGIDTAQFTDGYSVPEADFVNREQITYQQKKEVLTIRIHAADSMYRLDHFNVWINEVPLFGLKGISIKHRRSKLYDTTIAVHLSQGENRIETSVTNVNGTESYHMPMYVNYTPVKAVTETVYFTGIGINEFADSTHNLRWCVKDIRNLALKLKEKYPAIVIDTLFNKDVTISNVRQLKQRLLKTGINDKVIIAYSGHGMLSRQYDYYLSAYNVNFSEPGENGIAYEEIENLLDGIPARKKLLLLDACHSGELDKDELLAIQDNKLKTGNRGLLVNRGSSEEGNNQRRTVGLQNSFELMQSLFVNVGKGTGAVVIAAAGGVQFAQERGDLQNGVFSYALLEAMEQYKTITVSQLKAYVGKRVEDITRGGQRPTTRNELKETDWTVW